jgi:hypothetical protein
MNVYYGNLELIDQTKAQWFAKVQRLFFSLQAFGRTYPFGGLPGKEGLYGFCSMDSKGSVYTVVNPAQTATTFTLPRLHRLQPPPLRGRIIFRDAGFQPVLTQDNLTLGPEQMAVVGYGEYASREYDLGIQDDVVVPVSTRTLPVDAHKEGTNGIVAMIPAPVQGDLRIVIRQANGGKPVRTSAGAPPNGTSLGKLLRLEATQNDRLLPIHINYDKALWSGLSWAVGEISHRAIEAGQPVKIRCISLEKQQVDLQMELYSVTYQ